MAKDVQFKGGTLDGTVIDNAATEATLRELVNALNKKGGSGAGDAGLNLFQRSLTSSTNTVNTAAKTTSVFDSALDRAGKTASSFGGIFSGLGSLISSGVTGIFSGMITTGGFLIDTLKESYEGFKETSAVGATFNNNMIELQQSAAKANMSLSDYVKVVGTNSTALASLGGSVTEGAKRFADLSGEMSRGDIGEKFRAMGMTTADMNEGMLTYIDLQSRSGNITKMTNKELKEGATAYLTEMDALSKATGISRADMEKAVKTFSADPIIRNLQKGLNPEELAKSTAALAMVTKVGGTELLDAFKTGAAQVPNKMAQTMMLFDVGVQDFQSAFDGSAGPRGMLDIMEKINKKAEQQGMDQAALLAKYPELNTLMKAAQESARLSKMKPEELAKEQAANSNITRIMGETANAFETVFANIRSAFFDSDLFSKGGPFDQISAVLLDFLKEFTGIINSPEVQTGLKEVFSEISKWVTGLTSSLKNLDFKSIFADMKKSVTEFFKNMDFSGIIKIVTNAFSNIFGSLGSMVGNMFGGSGGGSPEDDKKKKELEDKKASIQAKTANGGTLGADDQKSLAAINSELDDLDKKTSGGGLTKFFSGLADTFKNLAFYTAVGSGVIILGLLGLGFALGKIALPLSGILLALGFASGGLGYMFSQLQPLVDSFGNVITKTFDGMATVIKSWGDAFKSIFEGVADAIKSTEGPLNAFSNIIKSTFEGISVVIKSFSDAFARIPETLSQLSKISAGDLLSVGAALVPLSAGLTTLAAPGLVAFFLGGSLDKLTDTLLKFNSLSPEGLSKTGSALKQFGSDVSTLLEGGSWFRGLTSNDGGLAAIATSLKVFNDINPEPILRLTPVLKQFGDAARSLIEGGSWWQGLIGNDGGLAGIAKSLGFFNLVNPEIMIKLSPVLIDFGAAARSLIEGGSWWQGLIGNDGGLAGIAKSLSEFNAVNPDILIRITPVLIDFGKGARSLIEGGSWWEGLIGNDGGLAGIAKSLAEFNNINPETLARITPILVDFGKGARTLIEGGSWWQGLVGNDGGLAEIAKSLAAFNAVNGENLTALTPILVNFGKGARTLIEGGSWWAGLTATDGGLTSLATTLSSFNKVNGSNLAALAPALVTFNTGAKTLIEGGSWWKSLTSSDGGLTSLANTLTSFNAVDGTNMNNIVSGMTGLKKAVDVNFKDSSENITNFRDSIKELNDELSNLSKKLSDIKGTSIGSTSTGSSSGSSGLPSDLLSSSTTTPVDKADKLNNMVSEMLELTKLIRDNTKDTADATKGRTNAI